MGSEKNFLKCLTGCNAYFLKPYHWWSLKMQYSLNFFLRRSDYQLLSMPFPFRL